MQKHPEVFFKTPVNFVKIVDSLELVPCAQARQALIVHSSIYNEKHWWQVSQGFRWRLQRSGNVQGSVQGTSAPPSVSIVSIIPSKTSAFRCFLAATDTENKWHEIKA